MRSDASNRPSPGGVARPLLSTERGAQSSPADSAAAEGDERVADVVADLPADAQAAEPVQQRDRSFHDLPGPGDSDDDVQAVTGGEQPVDHGATGERAQVLVSARVQGLSPVV